MEEAVKRHLREFNAPALPEKIEDWTRFLKIERSLNDLVEDIHRVLVNESEQYRQFLRAVHDSQAVEGSLSADNHESARMIREKAKEMNSEVQKENLATISRCLNIVMRRYHASRKERRNMIAGEILAPELRTTAVDNGSE